MTFQLELLKINYWYNDEKVVKVVGIDGKGDSTLTTIHYSDTLITMNHFRNENYLKMVIRKIQIDSLKNMVFEREYQILNENSEPELVKTISYEYSSNGDYIVTTEHLNTNIVSVKEIINNRVSSIKTVWKDKNESKITTYHEI